METTEEKDKYDFVYFYVRSQQLCAWLIQHKFRLLGLTPDRSYPSRNIFKFLNSVELRGCIEEYKLLKK